jgi:transcriptional regulator with XRE-family HTH domain
VRRVTDDATVTDDGIRHFYAELGHRIRAARIAHGLTQGALADRLDLTRTSIANLEAGRQRISAHTLAVAAAVLDVPLAELLPAVRPSRQPRGLRPDAPPQHVDLLRRLLAAPELPDEPHASA